MPKYHLSVQAGENKVLTAKLGEPFPHFKERKEACLLFRLNSYELLLNSRKFKWRENSSVHAAADASIKNLLHGLV